MKRRTSIVRKWNQKGANKGTDVLILITRTGTEEPVRWNVSLNLKWPGGVVGGLGTTK